MITKNLNKSFRFLGLLIFSGLLISSCQQSEKSDSKKITKVLQKEKTTNTLANKWANAINSNIDSLQNQYLDNAIKINSEGGFIIGKQNIINQLKSKRLKIDSITTIKEIVANKDATIEYEIEQFWTPNKIFKSLVIWNKKENDKKRELELIAEAKKFNFDLEELKERRDSWMKTCNSHNVKKLVGEFYSDNAIYYNHKPAIIGKDIIEEYQYMTKEKYQLTLTPIIVEPVHPNLIYEIGQCSGSYNGKYILVWERTESGQWSILMDSNI